MSEPDPAIPRVLSLNNRFNEAWEAEDWDAYAAAMTQDIVVVDHRPASLGSIHGRDAWIEATRTLREMLSDVRSRLVAQHVLNARGAIAHRLVTGQDGMGGEFEISFIVLNTMREGFVDRMEFYPVEQLDAALARFNELTGLAQ